MRSLKVSTLQIPEELLAGSFAGEEEVADVGAQVLVGLQTGGRGPVGVGPVCPAVVSGH